MIRKQQLKVFIALMACVLSTLSVTANSAGFYRWQDEHGVTHYSKHPPKNIKAVVVHTSGGTSSPTPTAKPVTLGAKPVNKSPADTANKEVAAAPTKDPARCAAAKSNLKTLTEKARVRIKEGDEYRFLIPEEMNEKRRIAQQVIDESC